MTEQQKIYRVLQLITRLKSGHFRINTLSKQLEVSTKTIDRYLKLLAKVGFRVEDDEIKMEVNENLTNLHKASLLNYHLLMFNISKPIAFLAIWGKFITTRTTKPKWENWILVFFTPFAIAVRTCWNADILSFFHFEKF